MEPRENEREFESLIPLSAGGSSITANARFKSSDSSGASSSASANKEAFGIAIRSWAWNKFLTGWSVLRCLETDFEEIFLVILFPIAITFYTTWWFIHFVDGFFSPIYLHLGIHIFGLGFVTSISFMFVVGVFMSSWVGAWLLALGEWFIVKMPLMSYIYAASKQISAAISPGSDQSSHAFKEVAIIKHPHIGEYAFGFITSSVVVLEKSRGEEEQQLCCVYVPTNHLYLGDMFLIDPKDVIRPNLSVREGIEIVISGGMSVPKLLTTVETNT